MRSYLRTVVVLVTILASAAIGSLGSLAQKPIRDLKPTVILISLDGFRYDYIDKYSPPALTAMAKDGVRAKWMLPSFPTKTFPNHYTIATGLYPEHHGIVENNVYDFGEVFKMDDKEKVRDPKWWWGEPIWVTAEKQGQISASYFFVGSEAKVEDTYPTYWRNYNGRVPNAMRVDKVLGWLDEPVDKRPNMIAMYFSITDDVGHEFGPDAEETKYAVLEADSYIGRLMAGLKQRKIDSKVNVIVVADHGMANVNIKNATFLDDHFDFDWADKMLWTNEIVQIFPKPGKLDAIYSRIDKLPHSTCWKKQDIPERLHYNEGRRIAPIVCSSEIGWLTTSHKRWDDWYKDQDEPDRPRGAHGYDNKYPEMRATFVAHGAAFKKGFVAEAFPNVDVYNLMCKILGLKAAKNDGDFARVKGMLR
ncbi:MAG TPA: ectonucleotide pyrophosphatase/phosphodiesterase [Pyrinomonadaceae bacterium]|nr:ectonucleotide pyrophosphatase/phosphodiesterase [Pyrinomonadaceae bacterium]